MIDKMELGLKLGVMGPVKQENLKLGKRLGKENLSMGMGLIIPELFIIINYMEKEYMFGLMGENIVEIGKIIELKEKEYLNGLMGENI